MKPSNRDLLVLVKDELHSSRSIEMELQKINQLLIDFETPKNLFNSYEVFDLNRYKKVNTVSKVEKIMREKVLKPFIFILNKN